MDAAIICIDKSIIICKFINVDGMLIISTHLDIITDIAVVQSIQVIASTSQDGVLKLRKKLISTDDQYNSKSHWRTFLIVTVIIQNNIYGQKVTYNIFLQKVLIQCS